MLPFALWNRCLPDNVNKIQHISEWKLLINFLSNLSRYYREINNLVRKVNAYHVLLMRMYIIHPYSTILWSLFSRRFIDIHSHSHSHKTNNKERIFHSVLTVLGIYYIINVWACLFVVKWNKICQLNWIWDYLLHIC